VVLNGAGNVVTTYSSAYFDAGIRVVLRGAGR
jgi:hypothetical protein